MLHSRGSTRQEESYLYTSIVFSRVNLADVTDMYVQEFHECIEDLLHNEKVQQLDSFHQHFNTSRLQHSLNVSYYSFLLCKMFRLDYRSATRAGLLHDLFLYDWRSSKQQEGNHAKAHPIVALRTAKEFTELNLIEEDAILKHMWPLTLKLPKYKESYIVTLADKYCATAEMIIGATRILCNNFANIKKKT